MQVGADEWGGGESCAWRGAVWLCLLLVAGAAMTSAQETDVNEMDAQDVRRLMAEFREQARVQAAQAEAVIERAGIEVRRDIVYQAIDGVDPERLSLDLYLPGSAQRRAARAPIVLYLHGGGWIAGSKAQSFLQPLMFLPEGFVFASANYRFRPAATVADMAQSAADAAGWLVRNAEEFGGDPHNIFLIGHSAGAHLVSLLGTNATFLENAGVPAAAVRGVISLDTAVYDLPKLMATTAGPIHVDVFGEDPSLQEAVSPWHHVRYGAPQGAFLIFYSDARPEGLTQAIPFGRKLRDAGHLATVVEAVDHDHGQVNDLLGTDGDVPTAQILDFVRRHAGASDYREAALDTGTPVDAAFWAANNPASIAAADPDRLRDSGLAILVECGAEDQFYNHIGNEFLHRVLSDRGIPHEYRLVLGEGHVPVASERLLAAFEFLGRVVRGDGEAKTAARAQFDDLVAPMRAWSPRD